MDFGFIKEEMMHEIDEPCDHGLILWRRDPFLYNFKLDTKLYITDSIPTVENLAEHWFHRLAPKIKTRSSHGAFLVKLRVYETPNCWADYEPGEK